ncbi:MAG TPA: hypothetical protein VK195_05265 [Burkholderiaceae bacterium]|nr:hypothetical protein [Burkholderiaceae bacterium]
MNTVNDMGKTRPSPLASALQSGLRLGLQWRLLLSWLLVLGLSTLLALLPLWSALGQYFNRSLAAERLLQHLDPAMLVDAIANLPQRGYSPLSGLPGLLLAALSLPWLSGMVQAAARFHVGRPTLGQLWLGGWKEYPQMARLWLWGLLPLGLTAALIGGLMNVVDEQARQWLLESDLDLHRRAILLPGLALLLLVMASLDAARALLVLEPDRRSVVKAWGSAVRGLLRRPSRLCLSLGLMVLGLLLGALLGWARIQVLPVGPLGVAGAALLSVLLVLSLARLRAARVLALVQYGRQLGVR